MKTKILLVEDDPNLGFVIQDSLVLSGYDVVLSKDGEEAKQQYDNSIFDLCLIDVMLPHKDGVSLAQYIRGRNEKIPIIFITAKSLLEDKIRGFEAGGDDYLIKPFSMEELLMRVKVFLRRSNGQPAQQVFQIGKITFDYSGLLLKDGKNEIKLTQKEADVLRLLCSSRDRVIKRKEILKSVWGEDDYFLGRSMDVFISKIRKYLKTDPAIKIVNYHGVGFKLEVKGNP
ncbi:MAG: response regulator transcription factor [Flammeovirgaceae bacterium]|nr:response regulator transcription factor [Flammeovirgaceae bacterium]